MNTDTPVLICLPAMGVAARFYARFAEALAAASGGSVDVMELRGQGTDPETARRGADFGYRELVEQDLPARVAAWRARCPGRPIVLVGHSLGGQLAVLASAALAPQLAGLVLVAAGSAHYRAWPAARRRRAALTVHAIRAVAALLPWYPGRRLGFGGDQPRRLMRDWSHNALTGRYRLEGSARSVEAIEQALRGVRLPVLALALRDDPVAPPGALDALLALLPAAQLTRRVIDGVLADRPWRRHFSWARAPDEAVGCIAPWLRDQLPPARRAPSLTVIERELNHVFD